MAIQFKDFFPQQESKGWLSAPEFTPIEDTVAKASEWIGQTNARVINVETIWHPLIYKGNPILEMTHEGRIHKQWLQVVRVWYADS